MNQTDGQIFISLSDVSALFYGDTEVSAAFLGNVQIWPITDIPVPDNCLLTEPDNNDESKAFIDENGIRYIECDDINEFDYNGAFVTEDGVWGILDEKFLNTINPDELRIINEDGIIATEDNLWGVADEKFDNISVDDLNIVNTYSGLLNERGVWLFEKENSNGAIEHD